MVDFFKMNIPNFVHIQNFLLDRVKINTLYMVYTFLGFLGIIIVFLGLLGIEIIDFQIVKIFEKARFCYV